MNLGQQNILFLTRTMKFGGTENVVLQLCEILQPKVNKIIVCSCGGIHVERLTEMGIKHYVIPDISEKKISTIIRIAKIIKSILKNENITIVHSHHRMAALYTRILSNKKILQVANAHNTFKNKKKMTQFAYSRTKVIAVGEQVKKNLIEYFQLPVSRVTVIHNAVKAFDSKIQPIVELEVARKEGYTLIGNIGRLSEQKGMEYFIQAAEKVLKKYPKVKFYIVGEGEDAIKLKNIAKQMLLEDSIRFLGYRLDIQNIMSQLDFIVLSSLWEGLPLTPIEAFSVSKTVIATSVDGTPEIVKDKYNGLLVESKNIQQLSDSILWLCQEKEFRKKLEMKASESYKSEFSFEKLAEKYIKFYQKLMK